jgi:hypothetical protein
MLCKLVRRRLLDRTQHGVLLVQQPLVRMRSAHLLGRPLSMLYTKSDFT